MKELSKLFTLLFAGHYNTGVDKEISTKKNCITYVHSFKVQSLNASIKEIRFIYNLFAVNFENSVTLSYGKVLAPIQICTEATEVAGYFECRTIAERAEKKVR